MWPRSWFTGKYPWARGAAVEARGSARCAVPSGCACGELLVGGGALGLTQADGRAQAAGAGGVATGLDTVHGSGATRISRAARACRAAIVGALTAAQMLTRSVGLSEASGARANGFEPPTAGIAPPGAIEPGVSSRANCGGAHRRTQSVGEPRLARSADAEFRGSIGAVKRLAEQCEQTPGKRLAPAP